jgi:hypothetical protein
MAHQRCAIQSFALVHIDTGLDHSLGPATQRHELTLVGSEPLSPALPQVVKYCRSIPAHACAWQNTYARTSHADPHTCE